MIFKKFRLQAIVKVALLMLSIFVLCYLIFVFHFHISAIIVLLIIIYQVVDIIHFVEKTNRYLENFLESIRYTDFSRSYQVEGLGASYDGLRKAFNDVITDFQKIRTEKEEHFYYLQNVIQHIGVSLIAFQKNGKVELINNAAKKLFQMNNLRNILLLKNFSKELVNTILQMKSGEKAMVKVQDQDNFLQLSIYATEFKIRERFITLVSIQNIQSELEEQEMEAWQKLIRVLTHEIMNSIAPISSLSGTVKTMMQKFQDQCKDQDNFKDITDALDTIQKRSDGLMHFVETYRNLTRIPKPVFKIFQIKQLFERVQKLMNEEITSQNIHCKLSINPTSLELTADEELIEQVLINLIKNSIHALEGREGAEIEMSAMLGPRGKIIIQIADNGPGILSEAVDKIFIPFFTTKKKGSGIGLSLSRQIVRLHGGNITVFSEPDKRTEFTLKF